MCRPTTVTETESSSSVPPSNKITNNEVKEDDLRTKLRKQATLYGTISLALVVVANSLLMGHKQSKMDELGCDAMCVGSMTSIRSALTVVGSTIIGRASDSSSLNYYLGGAGSSIGIGNAKRLFLIVGAIASALSISIAASATNLTGLWWSLLPAAIFQHNFNIMKALLGSFHDKTTSASDRASSVGMLGMAAGLGFMIGPPVGSRLCHTYQQASIVALGFLGISLVFILLIPTPTSSPLSKEEKKDSMTDDVLKKQNNNSNQKKDGWQTSSSRILEVLIPSTHRTSPVLFLMVCRTCMALAFHIFNTIWMITLRQRFNFGPKDYGTFFGYIGFIFAISQGFVAKWVLSTFASSSSSSSSKSSSSTASTATGSKSDESNSSITRRKYLLLLCCFILGSGRLIMYQTYNLIVVYIIYGIIITSLGVVNTIFNADTSQVVQPHELGGLFGVLASVETMAGIAGPIIGGTLTTKLHPTIAPLTAVAILYGAVCALIGWGYESILVGGGTGTGTITTETKNVETTDKTKVE